MNDIDLMILNELILDSESYVKDALNEAIRLNEEFVSSELQKVLDSLKSIRVQRFHRSKSSNNK